jgi:hypothetical protein
MNLLAAVIKCLYPSIASNLMVKKMKKPKAAAPTRPSRPSASAKDALDGLLTQIKRGKARIPIARDGHPPAMLISMGEFERLQAIDKSPHTEIIGRLLFAPLSTER